MPINIEKAFDKILYPLMIKTLNKQIAVNFNLTDDFYEKLQRNIIVTGERLNAFPLQVGKRQGCSLFPLQFNTVLQILANTAREEKET